MPSNKLIIPKCKSDFYEVYQFLSIIYDQISFCVHIYNILCMRYVIAFILSKTNEMLNIMRLYYDVIISFANIFILSTRRMYLTTRSYIIFITIIPPRTFRSRHEYICYFKIISFRVKHYIVAKK